MRNKQKKQHNDILFVLISSFIVVVAWIGFNIYHIYITSTISEEVQMQLTPINGTFDKETLQQLKNREQINPKFEKDKTASRSAPTPVVTNAPAEQDETEAIVSPAPATASPSAQTTTEPSFSIQGQ